jgi:cytochrome P450
MTEGTISPVALGSPAGPARTIPPVGLSKADSVVAFYDDQLEFTYSVARDKGPMVELWPGFILVTGPAEVDAILRSRDEEFVIARNILDRPAELTKGWERRAKWQQLRRAASAAMPVAGIDEHMAWLAHRTEALTDDWLARGRIPDLKTAVAPLLGESIARFCFGNRIYTQVPNALDEAENALFGLFTAIIDWPLIIRAFLPREWRARYKLRVLENTLREIMHAPGNGGMLDRLRRAGLNDDELVPILRSTLLAANGMPAASLAWALVELGRNPEEQETLARALAAHSGPGLPEQVGWVADETLRLWPSGFLGRRATTAINCAGWMVPARSEVMVPLWALHRLAPCFSDPERFISSRWATVRPQLGEYVPFGGGPNRCFGARFGRAQMCTVIATMIRRCHLTLAGGVEPADALSVLKPAGCELIVRPRQ